MFLSVQQAANRLGVSPVTIRRWTATGFLPCTRTAGGHRRIDEHDIDDLAKAIGGSNHLAAQLAREREVDVLVNTASALAVKLDLTELLLEIAMRMTSLLDCHFCAISEYVPEDDAVRALAEYDHAGQRLPDASPYRLRDFPLTRRVLAEQITAVVNVDDPHADPAEVAELRREGDRSLLMVPLVVQGRSHGPARGGGPEALAQTTRGSSCAWRAPSPGRQPWPSRTPSSSPNAAAATRTSPGCARRWRASPATCRTSARAGAAATPSRRSPRPSARRSEPSPASPASAARAPARSAPARPPPRPRGQNRGGVANLLVARDPSGATDLTLAVTLPHAPGEGQVELLDLIAAVTAALVKG